MLSTAGAPSDGRRWVKPAAAGALAKAKGAGYSDARIQRAD